MRSVICAALALATAGPAFAEPDWEQISDDDGIVVWQREVPDTSFVEFRGRGMVNASIKKILAVLRDQKRKTEWMASCVDNHAVQRLPNNRMIIYNRTGSPAFFVSDRDVVLAAEASYDIEKRSITLSFRETTHLKEPLVEGVVRMPKVRGSWHLQYLGPDKVEVTYQVQADPGGALPSWLVNWASSDLPRFSIIGLQKQVAKGGYDDELAAIEAAFDWGSLSLEKTQVGQVKTSSASALN